MIARLLRSVLGLCSRRALCLHLQLDLGDLEAPALDAELQLVARELSAGDGKAGVLVKQRRALAIAPISAPVVVVTPVGSLVLFEGKPTRRAVGMARANLSPTSMNEHRRTPRFMNRDDTNEGARSL